MDRSHFNRDVQVSEDVLDELRQMGMAAAIQKAQSRQASPEFVEAVRRFYPGAVENIDSGVGSAQPQLSLEDMPSPVSGGAPPGIQGQVSPAPPPGEMGGGNAPPVDPSAIARAIGSAGGGPMAGGAESTISNQGYEPGSAMERGRTGLDVAQMTGPAHAVQNALGMISPQQNAVRDAVPGAGAPPEPDPNIQNPMDRSLISQLLGITTGQQNASPVEEEIANPMDRSLLSKLFGRTTSQQNAGQGTSQPKKGPTQSPQAIARKLAQSASGGRLQ